MHKKPRHTGLPWRFDQTLQAVQHLFGPRKADPDIRLNEGDPTVFLSCPCPQFTISPP